MKYKIIPNEIVKNMIEFLDEIQFEAAAGNKPDDLHRINFINWMIGELMNGVEGFDSDDELHLDGENKNDRTIEIDKYRKEFGVEFPDDMSDEEWKNLTKQFDAFIAGWDKTYKKSKHHKKGKKNTLKNFERDLKLDRDLTPSEKFELYYSEHRGRAKEKGYSLNGILKNLGIEKYPGKNK